jgi:dTDP-4-dehydrorhamnose 3,5-epimerase
MSFLKNKRESEVINDLIIAELDPYEDKRGHIWTLFDQDDWNTNFVEDKLSISSKNILRGLHGDKTTDKLISCLSGSFFLVIVDARHQSPTYGNIETFIIDDKKPKLIFVPAGCLNGHLCLTKQCIFWYKWSKHYEGPENQVTCKWNDKKLNIEWPCNEPILSERDNNGTNFERIEL